MSDRSWDIPWSLDVGLETDVGNVRHQNEDSAGARNDAGVFVVADGVGGHRAGEVASRLAVEAFIEAVARARENGSAPGEELIRSAVATANQGILADAERNPERQGMGTTLTGLVLAGREFWIGHVGDSRAWRVRNGGAEQLTTDHTLVEEMQRQGKISREEVDVHPMRHVLSRCLGVGPQVDSDVLHGEVADGDVFVLATDGLVPVVDTEAIASIVDGADDAGEASERLVERGCNEYGMDNVTAVVVRCRARDRA